VNPGVECTDTVQAQARLIGKISRDDGVRLVLGQALGELQEKLGMGDIKAKLVTFIMDV
jgi:hypothetical protein